MVPTDSDAPFLARRGGAERHEESENGADGAFRNQATIEDFDPEITPPFAGLQRLCTCVSRSKLLSKISGRNNFMGNRYIVNSRRIDSYTKTH